MVESKSLQVASRKDQHAINALILDNFKPSPKIAKKLIDSKNNVYEKKRFIGEGGFGKCYLYIKDFDEKYCVKVLSKELYKDEKTKENIQKEINIHKLLDHKNIVQFYEFIEDNNYIYIISDYCENADLYQLLYKQNRNFEEFEVKYFLSQIIDAMIHCKSKNVIHRDLSLSNIFLTDSFEVKIGDFGVSTQIENGDKTVKGVYGKLNFIAPEMFSATGYRYEVDTWAIGIIMYTLLFRETPFSFNSIDECRKEINKLKLVFPDNIKCSSNAKDLITKLLDRNSFTRMPLERIKEHPFFKGSYISPFLPYRYFDSDFHFKWTKRFMNLIEKKKQSQLDVMTESNNSDNRSNKLGHKSDIVHNKMHSQVFKASNIQKEVREANNFTFPPKRILTNKKKCIQLYNGQQIDLDFEDEEGPRKKPSSKSISSPHKTQNLNLINSSIKTNNQDEKCLEKVKPSKTIYDIRRIPFSYSVPNSPVSSNEFKYLKGDSNNLELLEYLLSISTPSDLSLSLSDSNYL